MLRQTTTSFTGWWYQVWDKKACVIYSKTWDEREWGVFWDCHMTIRRPRTGFHRSKGDNNCLPTHICINRSSCNHGVNFKTFRYFSVVVRIFFFFMFKMYKSNIHDKTLLFQRNAHQHYLCKLYEFHNILKCFFFLHCPDKCERI